VELLHVAEHAWAQVATPLRAIADVVYLRKEISWRRDGIAFLTDSMRIDEEDLRALSLADYEEIRRSIVDRRTREYLDGLAEELA
jgi:hypothetical protein